MAVVSLPILLAIITKVIGSAPKLMEKENLSKKMEMSTRAPGKMINLQALARKLHEKVMLIRDNSRMASSMEKAAITG